MAGARGVDGCLDGARPELAGAEDFCCPLLVTVAHVVDSAALGSAIVGSRICIGWLLRKPGGGLSQKVTLLAGRGGRGGSVVTATPDSVDMN